MDAKLFASGAKRVGGMAQLARTLDVSQQVVSNWRRRGVVPPYMALAFAAATGISVKRVRADWADYWPELATQPATAVEEV